MRQIQRHLNRGRVGIDPDPRLDCQEVQSHMKFLVEFLPLFQALPQAPTNPANRIHLKDSQRVVSRLPMPASSGD